MDARRDDGAGGRRKGRIGRILTVIAVVAVVNGAALAIVSSHERAVVAEVLASEAAEVEDRFSVVMEGYEHSFLLFSRMMAREIERDPDPDAVEAFLKQSNDELLEVEGDTFDGLYLYYKGRYLYSWDTPHSVYEDSGYVATERPWYQDAVAAGGEPVLTPPYMSYANHYILSTVSQLQPDGETVFAYDIKMSDIQALAKLSGAYEDGCVMIYDAGGTIIGSTDESHLGSNLLASADEADAAAETASERARSGEFATAEERNKAQEEADAAAAFADFRRTSDNALTELLEHPGTAALVSVDGTPSYGLVQESDGYGFLVLVPAWTAWGNTIGSWLVPMLLVELLLVYVVMRASKNRKSRELRAAYVELGQMQSRLEIALAAAQKDAAVDELTGMMNARSFKKAVTEQLGELEDGDRCILIMLDGDRFKEVNDTYGHAAGDEAIKLAAQMIVGRIRTVDVAARLHGDEFAVLLSGTDDCDVAERLMKDVNETIRREARKRGVPAVTMSAGAVAVKRGDGYAELSRRADEALYVAKETHDGAFARAEPEG